ncbi:hypothetical protein F511_11540 [Dorcoceras hygrometricum]|uniref:Uncharacterized protein n=1 Tax=Dorcoceras hygrometricum TaxID=472368 RepID=A0A2Z7AM76_9LAMI|nr:hypothetical protein F511_11540 [Dorcoceras hygrometricum]
MEETLLGRLSVKQDESLSVLHDRWSHSFMKACTGRRKALLVHSKLHQYMNGYTHTQK